MGLTVCNAIKVLGNKKVKTMLHQINANSDF